MIEEIVNIIINWTGNNEKIFHMGDAILFLVFLVSVLYLFVFALFSIKRKRIPTLPPEENIVLRSYFLHTKRMLSYYIP